MAKEYKRTKQQLYKLVLELRVSREKLVTKYIKQCEQIDTLKVKRVETGERLKIIKDVLSRTEIDYLLAL